MSVRKGVMVQRIADTISVSKKRLWLERFPLMSARKGVMVQRIADTIFVSKKGYGSKGSREMGNFRSMCPEATIKVISEYHSFETCIFGH